MSKKNSDSINTDLKPALVWFKQKDWTPLKFQLDTWKSYLDGYNGLVNAPTRSGKTYSLVLPVLLESIRNKSATKSNSNPGLQVIWITPIR